MCKDIKIHMKTPVPEPLFNKVAVIFSPNAGKYGLGKTPYLDTIHAVIVRNGVRNATLFHHRSIIIF